MYECYFGLSKNPFSMSPDPDSLFMTDVHREALAGLSYAIVHRKGFVVLEGEAGTGKTTLLRKLLQMLPESEAQTSVVLNPVLTAAEFLELLLLNFGVQDLPVSKAQRLVRLEELLLQANRSGRAPVLIIDEAHKLNNEVLEEIRLLTNFETREAKLLQIVLTGQPELRDVLNRPDLWQLKQRVAVRLRIKALSRIQVNDYMIYRWNRAGATSPLPFGEEAVSMIALWSKGIPRLINSICDNALLLAFSDSSRAVLPSHIQEAVRDLDLGSRTPESGVAPAAPVFKESHRPLSNGQARTAELEPLKLGTLDRYMPLPEKRFLGLRWRSRSLAASNEGA